VHYDIGGQRRGRDGLLHSEKKPRNHHGHVRDCTSKTPSRLPGLFILMYWLMRCHLFFWNLNVPRFHEQFSEPLNSYVRHM
jgi:hypothetical protein